MRLPGFSRTVFASAAVALGTLGVPAAALADGGQRVAVLSLAPGAHYDGQNGLPRFPKAAVESGVYDLTQYTFDDLRFSEVDAAHLGGFDTVVLWGVRWDDPGL